MTECIADIEETRKEMYRVAKQMVKMKDQIINQKHSVVGSNGGSLYNAKSSKIGPSSVFQREKPNEYVSPGRDNII
jgi:hypothetical protein